MERSGIDSPQKSRIREKQRKWRVAPVYIESKPEGRARRGNPSLILADEPSQWMSQYTR